jgi:hypothetical protein
MPLGFTAFLLLPKIPNILPDKVEKLRLKYQAKPAHCSLVNPCAIALSVRARTSGVTSNLGLPIGFLLLALPCCDLSLQWLAVYFYECII